MIVNKETLKKLRGILPAIGSIEFVTMAHKEMENDEELKGFVPVFKCRQFSNSEAEKARVFLSKIAKDELYEKSEVLEIVGGCIEDWKNLYNVVTGEEFSYSVANISELPELVLRSLLNDLWSYSGTMR